MTDSERLQELIHTGHPCLAVTTFEEDYVLLLLRELAVELRREVQLWSVSQGLRDGLVANSIAIPDTEHPAAALCHLERGETRNTLCVFVDLAGHLKDERTLRVCREAIGAMTAAGSQLVLIDHLPELPPVIASSATRFTLSLPDETELTEIVKQTLRDFNRERPIEVSVTKADLRTAVRNLMGLSRRQAKRIILDTICVDRRFDANDINRILAAKRRALGDGVLEYVEAPVSLSEIGGLDLLKKWLARRTDCFSDEAVAFGLSAPRGILMLGVQGAGKSLAAKAVATAWQRPLLKMDAGGLYDRYIGESERRLRDALRQAEMMAPVVLWIDEIEKGFASAASQSSDGGLSKRMFGTLLTWMQEHRAPVFMIATANDIEALPPELLRKGRFDEIFFVDLPGLEARHSILEIHLKKRKREPLKFDVARLAQASEGFSGAEIEAAVIASLHDAFAAKEELTTEHVTNAFKSSPPLSVTMAEKIGELREWSHGRCTPADEP